MNCTFNQLSMFDLLNMGSEETETVTSPDKHTEEVAATNYVITDDTNAVGTPRERYKFNIEAITLLKKLEDEGRNATKEEKDVLARYVGWGGLDKAFTDERDAELRNLLTEDEYSSARASVNNSHFTDPVIPRAIYKCLERMGFVKGNILEPSMGVGVYFGTLPKFMEESMLYGVEIDSITGRIAKKLYPKAQISVMGFEKTSFSDNFFDLAIGNVPFGDYSVSDKDYDKHHFLIHDYFIAKAIDKVRPGGLICFITSTGTMDKKTTNVRKYISQRASLLGAVRLPNNAFSNAGTQVITDILMFQKKESLDFLTEEPWVETEDLGDNVSVNSYFTEHPEMVLGDMEKVTGPFGMRLTVKPNMAVSLSEQLENALSLIEGTYKASEVEVSFDEGESVNKLIPATPDVRNYTYTVVKGEIYYRQDSVMFPVKIRGDKNRVLKLIELRDSVLDCIKAQQNDCTDEELHRLQNRMRDLYNRFTQKYNLINKRGNSIAFSEDSSYYLLCSLELFDEEGEFCGLSDMFTKRTIRSHKKVSSVETAKDALIASMQEYGYINFSYMSDIYKKDIDTIVGELKDDIILNPEDSSYELIDDYLTGDIRKKLFLAKDAAKENPIFERNVELLEKAIPPRLEATDITVRLGATWVPTEYYEQFMHELFETTRHDRDVFTVKYSACNSVYAVTNKDSWYANDNVKANNDYGTPKINGFRLFEMCLNLKDAKVTENVPDGSGGEKTIVNRDETMVAQQKQDAIKMAWDNWVYEDMDRREHLVDIYNTRFNSTVPRTYNGDNLVFPGMCPEFKLRKHQLDAVARIVYGGNTLLAHAVGAGKTAESIAAAMELRRLGISNKIMFVVPNHLIRQWTSEFLRVYPSAKLLATREKDFKKNNRKKFVSKIATGDWDAIIIGHSQFERIPLSTDTERRYIRERINEVSESLHEIDPRYGSRRGKSKDFSVKQLETMKKKLEVKLDELNNRAIKDSVVYFEELGIDHLVVDESHEFKNLMVVTKLSNIGNVKSNASQKCTDMEMKVRYVSETVGSGHGITFLTGTPVANSISELYINMRYLMKERLQDLGLLNFDAWASTFGEIQTSVELAPEGTKYQAKSRFSKFYNLPELMSLFKEIADIKLAEDLKLPVPDKEEHNIVCEPTRFQKKYVESLSERADRVRAGGVDSQEDNMLKITTDGRKCALDQRIIDQSLPDENGSKVNTLVETVYQIYKETEAQRLTQMIFCDYATPKKDSVGFNIYEDIRQKLVKRGVPEEEIKFVHEANTDIRKEELFKKVRLGAVRVLLASTKKAGTGTNVQDRLIAMHLFDCPWRPADLEQRIGRIVRQGNLNEKVHIYTYVTKGTFDAYNWQLVEQKQKFIGQIMTSKSPARAVEDIDQTALSYAEIKALACQNPLFKEKMEVDVKVKKLTLLQNQFRSSKYSLEKKLAHEYPDSLNRLAKRKYLLKKDIEIMELFANDLSEIEIEGVSFTEEKACGKAICDAVDRMRASKNNLDRKIGTFRGLDLVLRYSMFGSGYLIVLSGMSTNTVDASAIPSLNVKRILEFEQNMRNSLVSVVGALENTVQQIATARVSVEKPFEHALELATLKRRQAEIDAALHLGPDLTSKAV